MHVRAQIRAAAVAALTGLSTTGARVYAGRTRPLADGHAPSLLVYADEERSLRGGMGPPLLDRRLTLVVEGRVAESAPPDATLDAIAEEVEAALGAADFGGLALAVTLQDTRMVARAEGERHHGAVVMSFEVLYRTAAAAPARRV